MLEMRPVYTSYEREEYTRPFGITPEDGKVVINQNLCVGCGVCVERCSLNAISIKQTMPMREDLREYFLKDYNLDLKVWKDTEENS